MVPVQDKDELTFYWSLPYAETEFEKQPLMYLGHLFGHEGENSLSSWLKNQGLALSVSAGAEHVLWGFSNFEINVELSKKGLENYEEVIEAVYQYANTINERGPQEYIFKECKNIGEMSFEFAPKQSAMMTVVGLSRQMQVMKDEQIPKIMKTKFVAEEYDPE